MRSESEPRGRRVVAIAWTLAAERSTELLDVAANAFGTALAWVFQRRKSGGPPEL